ncbi:MAG: YggT family protein [Ardenticatenia bacterium]|nr:YggT family protein [Ardenticatenia bacterium]
MTDPILEPFRRLIPPIGMVDISPIVAILVLQVVQSIIVETLRAMAL